MRPSADGLVIRPFDESGPLTDGSEQAYFKRFDASKANCYLSSDRHNLLAVIEAGYGSITAFNLKLRSIVTSGVTMGDERPPVVVVKP